MSWEIRRKLSTGEGTETYRADFDARPVVLKLLLGTKLPADWTREVLFLSRLAHPSLVSIYGGLPESASIFGQDRGPCYWMEFVEGRPILDAAQDADKDSLHSWLVQGLEALSYLHGNGILHGDISPNNLFVDSGGRLRLLDFGLASLLEEKGRGMAGTFPYMAPEVFQGDRYEASDLFSLGTVFYELLAKRHPRAECRDLNELVKSTPPALKHGLMGRIVERLIEIPLTSRISSADDALHALRSARGSQATAPKSSARIHSFRMLGAEGHFENLQTALRDLPSRSRLVAVHGATGVGKTRFLREADLLASLKNAAPEPFRLDFQNWNDGAKVSLFQLHEKLRAAPGRIAFLEWNDDFVPDEACETLQKVLAWPETLEVNLQPLDEKDTETLARLGLGAMESESARRLYRISGGYPALLLQQLEWVWEKRASQSLPSALSALEAARGGAAFWEMRLQDLSNDDLRVLARLAAAGQAVHRADCTEDTASLSRLRQQGLIREEAMRLQLASPLLAEAIAARHQAGLREAHQFWWRHFEKETYPHTEKLRHATALGFLGEVTRGLRITCEKLQAERRFREALTSLDSDLPLLQDADERSRCLRLKINLLNETGRYEDAERVREQWKSGGGKDEPAPVQAFKDAFIRGFIAANRGRFEDARDALKLALKLLKKEPVAGFEIRTRALLAKTLIALEDFERADELLQEAEGSDPPPQGRELGEILRNHGQVAARRGRWAEAEAHFSKSAALYEDAAYPQGLFSTCLQAGLSAVEAGQPEKASDFYARAEDVADTLRDERSRASVWTNQGVLARKAGQLAAALALAKRAEEIFEFLGNPRDLAAFHRHRGFTLAALGRFDDASVSLERLETLSRTDADDLRAFLDEVRLGVVSPRTTDLPPPSWNLEDSLRQASQEGETQAGFLKTTLEQIRNDLSPELQVTFMERYDYRRSVSGEKPAAGKPSDAKASQPTETGAAPASLLTEITRLNQSLAGEEDIPKVLSQLMDAALRLSGAENGCLLVPDDNATGALAGFAVAAQRNMSFDTGAPAYSVSAVKRAIEARDSVVTDNALQDERFRDAKSIHARNLRSILALPVSANGAVLGVFYLDHRLEDGLFRPDTVETMKAFASIAALALQKGRLIEGLKKSNADLAVEVSEQEDEVEKLHREVLESRRLLKNEYKDIVGRSPKMMEVLSLVDRITDAKISVWIYGESGTGKEAVARSLHYNSARAKQAFVGENCSSLPETLLESELFGHKKGSFTQAVQDKKGLLEFAHKGTVFLDEIADMSLNLQSKLLRFLQEGEIRPIGSNQMIRVDVRVVSASNKDLKKLVAEGRFREDLYYRLNGVTVRLPPLRDRKEDIPLLADHFLKRIIDRDGLKHLKLEAPALKFLMKQNWPGNIRQLQNVIETAALFAEKNVITMRALQSVLTETELKTSPAKAILAGSDVPADLKRILEVIQSECFNRSKAAKTLGMSRRHLYRKLAKYSLNREEDLKGFLEGNPSFQ